MHCPVAPSASSVVDPPTRRGGGFALVAPYRLHNSSPTHGTNLPACPSQRAPDDPARPDVGHRVHAGPIDLTGVKGGVFQHMTALGAVVEAVQVVHHPLHKRLTPASMEVSSCCPNVNIPTNHAEGLLLLPEPAVQGYEGCCLADRGKWPFAFKTVNCLLIRVLKLMHRVHGTAEQQPHSHCVLFACKWEC